MVRTQPWYYPLKRLSVYNTVFLMIDVIFCCCFCFGCPKASGAPSPRIRSKLQPLTKPQQHCIHVPARLCPCQSRGITAGSPDFSVQRSSRSYSVCLTETLCPLICNRPLPPPLASVWDHPILWVYELITSNTSAKWSHTVFVFLGLAYCT